MKIALLISIFNLIVGCSNTNIRSNIQDNSKVKDTSNIILVKDTSNVHDSIKIDSSSKTITLNVFYAAIECSCPQWAETKFKDVKFLEGVERFYLEPASRNLIDADTLWDGEHLPLILKVTGRFSAKKEIPTTYPAKVIPEKARIFWYDKITVISPSS